jgi:hypothetical protein
VKPACLPVRLIGVVALSGILGTVAAVTPAYADTVVSPDAALAHGRAGRAAGTGAHLPRR